MTGDGLTIVVPTIFREYAEVRCGLSTRVGGVSPEGMGLNLSYSVGDDPANVAENRRRFFAGLGIDGSCVAFPRQVHGDTVRAVSVPGSFEACDALVTEKAGVFLGVSVADCLPAFLYDPRRRCVAGVHAGWRGSRSRILEAAVRLLVSAFGTRPADLVAYLGPSAGACCYEVGEEVAEAFEGAYVIRKTGRRPHLDLKSHNRQLLLEAGVRGANVEV